MNDVNQIRPCNALNEDFPATTVCIKQEPLDIAPDDLPDADCKSDPESKNETVNLEVMTINEIDRNLLKYVNTRKIRTLKSKNIQDIDIKAQKPIKTRRKIMEGFQKLEGIDVDEKNGNMFQSVKIRKRRTLNINLVTLEDIDKKVLKPFKKERKIIKSKGLKTAESVESNFKCSEKYCDFDCNSVEALDSHINLRHGQSLKEDERIKLRKSNVVASPESETSQDDTEEECGPKQEFVDVSGFVVRLENTYSSGRLMFTCSRCKNTFHKRETGRAHIVKVHMNIKRFTCSVCGKGYNRALDLEAHKTVHTGERPFKCPAVNCVYSTSWTGSLKTHIRRRHKDCKGELTLAVMAKKKTYKQVLAVEHKLSDLKSENPSSPTITTRSEMEDTIFDKCCKAEQTEPLANLSSLGQNHDSETIADKIEERAEVLSIEQAPPVEDVKNDSGQLDVYEEANIIDNRNEKDPHYTCKICSENFEHLYAIKRHVNDAHKNVRRRTCMTCGITLAHSYSITTHIKIHTGERPHKCEDCGKDFITNYALRRHARSVHKKVSLSGKKEVSNECIICKTIFENARQLEKHASIHVSRGTDLMNGSGLTPYENAKITNSESLGTTVYTCNICNIQFSVLSVAKNHVNNKHKDVKTLSCLYCGSTASSLFTLKKHIAVHDSSSTFKCFNSRCSYDSGEYENIQHHLRDCGSISNRTAVRKCTICNVEFGELGILQSHFRTIHKVAISYSCLHCEYSFAALSDLTEHIKSHDDIQPMVQCPIENCQFIVTSEEDRRKHLQWHETKCNPRPRPFVCECCGTDFSVEANLRRHMKRFHSQ